GGDLAGGSDGGGGHPAGTSGRARSHADRHRLSAFHHRPRRPGPVPGGRADRRGGYPLRAAGPPHVRGHGPRVRAGGGMSDPRTTVGRQGSQGNGGSQGRERSRLARALDRTWFRRNRDEPVAFEEAVPPGGREGLPPSEVEPPAEDLPQIEGAIRLLRRGLRETPELRAGLGYTLGMAMALTAGRLLIPVLVQQILDRGLNGPAGFRPRFVYGACAVAAGPVGLASGA